MVVHGDGEILDLLTRWFEASGFDVITAVTAFRAQPHLEGDGGVDVVVTPWDAEFPVGGELYRWVLLHRPALRTRFVFIADEVPPDFDAVVGGLCLAVPLNNLEELVQVAQATISRVRTPPRGTAVRTGKPSLLLADDDPFLLGAMAELLDAVGYAVSPVESTQAALELVEFRDFDAIVTDWRMHDGTGADLYQWIARHKPDLTERVVFLAETDLGDADKVPGGRPVLRKGQDSQALTDVLRAIAKPTPS